MNEKYVAIVAEIEKAKESIGKERDRLRELCDELESLVDVLDDGMISFDTAIEELKSGIETVSQYT